jgi:hypothetical protein
VRAHQRVHASVSWRIGIRRRFINFDFESLKGLCRPVFAIEKYRRSEFTFIESDLGEGPDHRISAQRWGGLIFEIFRYEPYIVLQNTSIRYRKIFNAQFAFTNADDKPLLTIN